MGSKLWSWWGDIQLRTFVLINLAAVVERADEALLPAVYREVGVAFHSSPSGLGLLTLVRALAQALSFPLAAYLALNHSRTSVIAGGALIWGIATSAVGFASSYVQVVLARALNGLGLALVIPAIQSIVADTSTTEDRGWAFGWLSMTGNAGAILGGIFGILLAGNDYFGVAGWRMAFHLTAGISYILAAVLYRYAAEPRPLTREERNAHSRLGVWESMKELLVGAKQVLRVQTFQIIVAQGVVGSFPWAALAFAAMWLELIGFSHTTTAVLLGTFSIFNAAGALFGGYLGDRMAHLFPNAGRIICSQMSSGIAVPLSAILLRTIPPETKFVYIYSAVLSIMGFLISWNASATNNPIFAEIVPEHLRTSVYALDRTFEMGLAAFAPPTVGYLTEHLYGYKPPKDNTTASQAHNVANSVALSKGLFATVAAPFLLCCLIYTLLYWTYPRDRDMARAEAVAAGLGHVRLTPLRPIVEEDEMASLADADRTDEGRTIGDLPSRSTRM